MSYTVYILKCSDQTLYTGYTNNLEKRIQNHNEGKTGAKYTRSRRPVKLVYTENFKTLSPALKREIAIKKLSRAEKLRLIKKQYTKLYLATKSPNPASDQTSSHPQTPAHD